jgi:NitT/TauT family transport system permease protein
VSPTGSRRSWLAVRKALSSRRELALAVFSFVLPLLVWSALSYVPFLWHPYVRVTHAGSGDYAVGSLVERATFAEQVRLAQAEGRAAAEGVPANPVYLPAPHQVAQALYTAFKTPPRLPTEPWLHQSLGHSLKVILWGFLLSSIVGIPLGILCGTFSFFSKLTEPFIEFFRYLPAPAFGALCVAILGIYDAPKVAVIFIGTFFQQVLVVANTTRRLDICLIEAAQTLGASRKQLVTKVVVPGVIVDLYTDTRILLGWAWTYLMVAELVGTTTGITYFINQQARYRNYANVYAGIALIGLIGLSSDLVLAWIGRRLFPWQPRTGRVSLGTVLRAFLPARAGEAAPPEATAA